MRPTLRNPLEVAHLLDEVQSLLMQYDRNAYNQRQELPKGSALRAAIAAKRVDNAAQVEDLTMDAPQNTGAPPSPPNTEPNPGDAGYVPAGRLSGTARAERLAQIRAQIAAGTYDNEDRFEKALDRLLQRIDS